MQGLFNVLEAELQSYIHFADRLDPLWVYREKKDFCPYFI